ncbi:MAG: MATE family efflux transporter [Peptostreptococcaceae bacterium]|jgi:putative MATE family efflux protein|nr:MATE family efflux transporter [Peptostreptococcaceae bacterium]
MDKGSINKLLFKLSAPAIVGMLINAIYNIVDSIFIGKYVGSLGLGATSIFLPIQMIILAFSILIGVGSASVFSIAYGKKDYLKLEKITGNIFFLMIIFSFLVSIIGTLFTKEIMILFGSSQNILPYAISYSKIMFLGVLFMPICITYNNIIRAEGNSIDGMNMMIIGMLANIVLDYIFIVKMDMGMFGAGFATSISKFINFSYLVYYLRKKTKVKFKIKNIKFDLDITKEVLSIGASGFVQQLSMSFIIVFLNKLLFTLGSDLAISIYAIIYKLSMFFMMPIMGTTQGMAPIVGFNYGANKINRVFEAFKKTIFITSLIGVFGLILIISKPDLLLSLFSNDKELISTGSFALKLVLFSIPLMGFYTTSISFFQAIGLAKMSFIISLLRQVLLFIPILFVNIYILKLGLNGIWLSFLISDILAFLISLFIVAKEIKKINTITEQKQYEYINM